MVPGSTLMYGSSFCIVTRRPRILRRRPSEEAVRPLPRELATPPVTKMCFATCHDLQGVAVPGEGTKATFESRAPALTCKAAGMDVTIAPIDAETEAEAAMR